MRCQQTRSLRPDPTSHKQQLHRQGRMTRPALAQHACGPPEPVPGRGLRRHPAWPASAGATIGAKRRAAVRWRPGPEVALRTAGSQTQTAVRVAGSAARTARTRRPEAGPGGLEDGRFGNAFRRREMRRGSQTTTRIRPVRQRAHASLDAIGKHGRRSASGSGPAAWALQPLLIQPAPPRGDQSDSSDSDRS